MKSIKYIAALGAAALVLTACGGGTKSEDKGEANADYMACLVSDAGGWDDKSFNQSAKEGLDKAVADLKIKDKTAESKDSSDFDPNVASMVDSGCSTIIGVGFNLADAIGKAAADNPDLTFGLVDSGFDEKYTSNKNTRALLFNTQEAAYLAGYAAAAFSKTGTVGTFGGIQLPSVTIFMDGFVDGVAAYNKDNGKDVKVLGWDKEKQSGLFTNTFDDQALGTQFGNQLISQGADVIMPVAGPVGLGAAAAAQSAGNVYIVGVDSDWYESTPYGDIVLTSVMKGINPAVFDTFKLGSEGKFSTEPYVGTIKNGGVSIAPFHNFESQLPAGLADKLAQMQKDIADGKLKVESPSSN